MEVTEAIKNFSVNKRLYRAANLTLVTLIPKKPDA